MIRKRNFPLYVLKPQTDFHIHGLYLAMATHNCGILSKSRVHSPGNAPCFPTHKFPSYTPIMHHSPCLHDVQTPFLQAVLHSINPPLPWPTHLATTNTLPYINALNNPINLHSLHKAELSANTFINLFVHTLHHSTQLPYPCIRDFIHSPDTHQTSEVFHLYSPNPRPFLFPLYHCLTTVRKNRHQQ